MSRENAIALATGRLDAIGNDFSFGKPSQDDLLKHADDIAAQIGVETGHSLAVSASDTGISFS